MSLVCPSCGRAHVDEARFCADCGVPLVAEGGPAEAEVSEQQARMRKIKPQYGEGDLVRVAVGRQQPEAELIQNLLLDEGVPSTLRRNGPFDAPRDVLVPSSGLDVAREVLGQSTRRPSGSEGPSATTRHLALLLVVLVGAMLLMKVISVLAT